MIGLEIIVIGAGFSAHHMARTIHAIEIKNKTIEAAPAYTHDIFIIESQLASPMPLTAVIIEGMYQGMPRSSRRLGRPHPVAGPLSGPALCKFCKLRRSLRPP